MKVAVVGSGVSGLVAAYRLAPRHDVTVFETADRIGGHVHTVPVEVEGQVYPVDTGFIVYNEGNYPLFTALLSELGVASQPTSMSFSVTCERTGTEYNGETLDKLLAQRTNVFRPRFWRMVADILRFHREGPAETWPQGDAESVEAWTTRRSYSREFVERYLTPLGSALWSCPEGVFRSFPMRFVVEFLENHAMLQVEGRPTWRVIRGGSQCYVDKLVASFRDRIRLATPVEKVERTAGGVRLVDGSGAAGDFDHVVFACHADQALRILGEDATATERELLGAFPYQVNEAVLHTDPAPLPARRKAWASWNYRLRKTPGGPVSVTYNMNSLQSLPWVRCFNVTLNDDGLIDPERVVKRIRYEHPVFTAKRGEAQARREEISGVNRVSYCGAYWGNGFHEAGVRSAHQAVEAIERSAREAAA